jgi:PAS domain S-box-containing protein
MATVAIIALGAASFTAKVRSFQPLGFEATAIGETWQVTSATAPSSGLQRGDRILTVNGELVGAGNGMSRASLEEQLTARGHSELLVERDAGLEQIDYRRPPLEIDFAYLLLALTGVIYLIIGLYTLARGADRQVVLFNLWALASATVYLFTAGPPFDALGKTLYLIDDLALLLLPPLTLHFFLTFPRTVTDHTWLKRTIPFLYLPAVVLLTLHLDQIQFGGRFITGPPTEMSVLLSDRLDLIHRSVFILLALGVLVLQLARSRRDEARQVLWITLGMAGGYVPFLSLYLLPRVVGFEAPKLIGAASVLPLVLVPLSFAYAILRYRLWDIAIIVRDVATYALTLLLGVFGFSLLNLAIDRGIPQDLQIARYVLTFLAGLFVAGLLIPTRQGISSTLQRFHYRGNYRRRRALSKFGHDLLHERNLEKLSSGLLRELEDGLDLDQTNLYLVEGDRLLPVLEESQPLSNQLLVSRLGDHIWQQDFENITAISLPEANLESIQQLFLLGYRYAFPLTVRERHVGVVVVGYKQDQVPLNSDDLLLVRQMLNQASLAIENAQLVEQLQRQLTEVLELKQFNEEIIESSPAGIVVLDGEDNVVTANVAFANLVGAEPLELRRRNLRYLLPIDDVPTSSDGILALEMSNIDGDLRQLQVSVASLLGHSPAGMRVVVVQDVTERVEMEKRLKEQERLAALGTMAAGVAHEVNTPLTGISSYAQMLLADTPEEDHRHAILQKVERQTFRAARIVNSLLEYARSSEPGSAPVDMVELVDDACDLLEKQISDRDVTIEWRHRPAGPALARVNEGELHQVVTNLVLNAVDAVAGRKTRVISLEVRECDEWITITVSDTGTGIENEILDRIFQPFFTTKSDSGGTGLGLSLSHEIVRRYDGQLLAENLPQGGCRLTLRVPSFRSWKDRSETGAHRIPTSKTSTETGGVS